MQQLNFAFPILQNINPYVGFVFKETQARTNGNVKLKPILTQNTKEILIRQAKYNKICQKLLVMLPKFKNIWFLVINVVQGNKRAPLHVVSCTSTYRYF